jgi:hypothetical protein
MYQDRAPLPSTRAVLGGLDVRLIK